MTDRYATFSSSLDSPADTHLAITPGPDPIVPRPRALYCNTAGTVTVVDRGGVSLTYTVSAGQILPFRAVRITAATATVYGWE